MPKYSIVVPVYNRPAEIEELLASLTKQLFDDFEVVVVEDGSEETSEKVIEKFETLLNVRYLSKENSGPGPTRNFGASNAEGEWLIFLDSDCFLDEDYLKNVNYFISDNQVDYFGGPDRDHPSFTSIQKGINYAMTSILTTGGIRGSKSSLEKFKPRSFNMGIRKSVFDQIDGFAALRFGEDIDLSLRIESMDFKSSLISDAYVYHKRRSTFRQFFKQIYNSGIARIKLFQLYPNSLKLVHLMPSLFLLFHLVMIFSGMFYPPAMLLLIIFPFVVLFHSLLYFKSLKVAITSLIASYVQLFAYGLGFIDGYFQYLFKGKVLHAFEKNFYS